MKQKDRIAVCFNISKEIDQKFRAFLADKYHGYHKGALSKEFELALVHFMNDQKEDRE